MKVACLKYMSEYMAEIGQIRTQILCQRWCLYVKMYVRIYVRLYQRINVRVYLSGYMSQDTRMSEFVSQKVSNRFCYGGHHTQRTNFEMSFSFDSSWNSIGFGKASAVWGSVRWWLLVFSPISNHEHYVKTLSMRRTCATLYHHK